MAKFFGTDGVRGLANTGKMTPNSMLRLGRIAGQYFASKSGGRSSAVIGKDTRLSGDMIESALIAGLTSAGMDVKRAGVLPTSGTALMTKALGADLGVMITASHNKYPDNGVKVLAPMDVNSRTRSKPISRRFWLGAERALSRPLS